MSLFTFFLEYEGGTYISQVEAPDFTSAPKIWAEQFKLPDLDEYSTLFESNFEEKLIESLDLQLLCQIKGLINTWAFTAYKLEKPATIHFTQTAR